MARSLGASTWQMGKGGADFACDTTDGLLEYFGADGVGRIDTDNIPQLPVMGEHRFSLR